jgi:hypothetical protein
LGNLIRAILHDDEASVEAAVVELARSHRFLAPLTFLIGALMLLIQGLRVVFSNWRLFLLQVLPAMWIWLGMLDLKAHLFRGHTFTHWQGAPAILLSIGIVGVTVATYFLNAVFAFAIASPGSAEIRPAFRQARNHMTATVALGGVLGLALAFSAVIVPRWGTRWFALSLGIVLGLMMVTYVAFPVRLIGPPSEVSRRDKLGATVVGGAVGAVICFPGYLLGRVGVLLLGSHLLALGVILLSVGFGLQAGASGAVKAVKMSVKLAINQPPAAEPGTTA